MIDLTKEPKSNFLSCEKDTELVIRRLFGANPVGANKLKSLLVVNNADCLDKDYTSTVREYSLARLKQEGYITQVPRFHFGEFEKAKSMIVITFDDFTPNATNPQFRDCNLIIEVVCPTDYWELGDFRLRPLKIVGYIDGMLNGARLTGIGQLNFMSCKEMILSYDLSGYRIVYRCVHDVADNDLDRQ